MAAMKNDEMASTMHINTLANESPRDEQNFEKMCVNNFVSEKKFNYSTELSFTTEFQYVLRSTIVNVITSSVI
jgi:hypothetical protein